MCVCVCVCVCVCTGVCAYICVCVCVCLSVLVCLCAYVLVSLCLCVGIRHVSARLQMTYTYVLFALNILVHFVIILVPLDQPF